MDIILAATCIVVGGIMLYVFFLVVGTLRLVGELRDAVGFLRFRLKQVEARVLWAPRCQNRAPKSAP